MSIDANDVRSNASAIVATIARIPQKERDKLPGRQLVENFNMLLEIAQEVAPQVDKRLWPHPIAFRQQMNGVAIPDVNYTDLEIYARQIYDLVPIDFAISFG